MAVTSDATVTRPRRGPAIGAADDTKRGLGTYLLLGVFAVGLALRLSVAVLPERLLTGVFLDDGLYYLRIARELAHGHGSTFDGIHGTNGYHPLWAAILAVTTGWARPTLGVVRCVVVLQATIAAAAFIVLARALSPWIRRVPLAIGLGLWWINPVSLVSSISGLETALMSLMFALLVAAALRYRNDPTLLNAVVVGVVSGLLYLSRSDTAFAVLAVGIWLLIVELRSGEHRAPMTMLKDGAACLAAGVVVVVPWIVWNLSRFGTIEQSSMWARPLVSWDLYLTAMADAPRGDLAAEGTNRAVYFLGNGWFTLMGFSRTALCVAVAILVLAAIVCGRWTAGLRQLALLSGLLVASGLVLGLFHEAVRWSAREYYFEWVRMAIGIGLAVLLGVVTSPHRPAALAGTNAEDDRAGALARGAAVMVTVALLVWATGASVQALAVPASNWQVSMKAAGDWVAENIPSDEPVLSFNSGYVGYFSDGTVINLDGVVNNDALEAVRARRVATYICDSGSAWIVDFFPTMFEQYKTFMGPDAARIHLEEVKRIRVPGSSQWVSSDVVVQRLSCDA